MNGESLQTTLPLQPPLILEILKAFNMGRALLSWSGWVLWLGASSVLCTLVVGSSFLFLCAPGWFFQDVGSYLRPTGWLPTFFGRLLFLLSLGLAAHLRKIMQWKMLRFKKPRVESGSKCCKGGGSIWWDSKPPSETMSNWVLPVQDVYNCHLSTLPKATLWNHELPRIISDSLEFWQTPLPQEVAPQEAPNFCCKSTLSPALGDFFTLASFFTSSPVISHSVLPSA